MPKNIPPANLVETGDPVFAAGIQQHIMTGGQVAGNGAHSGLHSLNTALATYGNLTQVVIETDSRVAGIYAADVSLRGGKATKRSSFFPATMNWVQIQAAITQAWRDSRTYTPRSDIYRQLRDKYGLSWVGYATIGGQRIWIGATRSGVGDNGIDTAFPAVNNKFF